MNAFKYQKMIIILSFFDIKFAFSIALESLVNNQSFETIQYEIFIPLGVCTVTLDKR